MGGETQGSSPGKESEILSTLQDIRDLLEEGPRYLSELARQDSKREIDTLNYLASSPEFLYKVRLGLVPGYSIIGKFGRNPDIDTASGFEAIWTVGGDYTGHNATDPETLEIFSSSALDLPGGGGAELVEVCGLDDLYRETSQTVQMNGVTSVFTTKKFIRANRAVVKGSNSNLGNITIRQSTTTANVMAQIDAGFNQALIAAYTIPTGKRGLVISYFASVASQVTANMDVILSAADFGGPSRVQRYFAVRSTGSSFISRNQIVGLGSYCGKTDLVWQASSSANNASLAVDFDILLMDEAA